MDFGKKRGGGFVCNFCTWSRCMMSSIRQVEAICKGAKVPCGPILSIKDGRDNFLYDIYKALPNSYINPI